MKRIINFFQSIRFKIIIIYILLLLIAIQVIGGYFARQLETKLLENYSQSINDRIQLLTYSLEQAFSSERREGSPTLQESISSILSDFDSDVVTELQVIDMNSRIVGTTNRFNKSDIGKKTTRANRTLIFGTHSERKQLDPNTGNRNLVMTVPIFINDDKVGGAIYLQANLENVYNQLQEINNIFAKGTMLAVTISALLGIFVARTISKPITEMRKQAKIMAEGDFSNKVNIYGADEIGQLAISFNELNDKLKQAQANTEGERRKLISVLGNMNDGVIATDHVGNIILMNDPAIKLLGKPFEEIKGQPLIEVLDLNHQLKNITDIWEKDSIIIDFSTPKQPLLLKARFSVIQDENDEMNGFITVLSDVTEQEKIEQERKEFVANVSHELRTPLTTMRSYIDALTEGETWKDPVIAPKFLHVTQTETERMIRLVNDLLQLSKMDNKDYKIRRKKINFTPFFHHIIDRFEMNKREDIQFVRYVAEDDVWVLADKDKLTQVVDNIISNAIKYSPEGGNVTFRMEINNNLLQVHISDEGVGIPKEQVDKVFERFYRVDKARSRNLGGTGLGLAIAKELIEAHGGKIWARSKEGKGTTISFSLPLTEIPGDEL
ncbi:cell wall metabolism sensor histidine kinase WalK [Salirhabdus salicampi]|uniref:cell wall metabolism sensor histidine kinase WalK n=1 Tax=Salirhabdus salicampi TaxID=476102 RepID=UPI0020C509CC|nr:cell wall metabolism sensor histidine kinase WalK [Salirhabdus salicampi]MCP8617232.1 cell wall metabolism sensor histidine kinase WalK [Salirhabdus salicampi]